MALPNELWLEVFKQLNPLDLVRLCNEDGYISYLVGTNSGYWSEYSVPALERSLEKPNAREFKTALRESPFELLEVLSGSLGVFSRPEIEELRKLRSLGLRDEVSPAKLGEECSNGLREEIPAWPALKLTDTTNILRAAMYQVLASEFMDGLQHLYIDEIYYGVAKLESFARQLQTNIRSDRYLLLVEALIEELEKLIKDDSWPSGREGFEIARRLVKKLRILLPASAYSRLQALEAVLVVALEEGSRPWRV
jgi:hypothetical protein